MTAKSAAALDSGIDRERGAKQAVASKPAHYGSLVIALIALTFATGLIDAVSYLGLGRVLTANMTGNIENVKPAEQLFHFEVLRDRRVFEG